MSLFNFNRDKENKNESSKRPNADFSDVSGGSSTTAPPPQSTAPAAASFTEYRVEKGDSLSLIAKRFYGDPMLWKRIFEANRGVIDDPDKIYPGQMLKIPTAGGATHA